MNDSIVVKNLAYGVRMIKASAPSELEEAVEGYLGEELHGVSPQERLRLLEKLAEQFDVKSSGPARTDGAATEEIVRLVSLFLGKSISPSEINSTEISEKFASSLNTLFDTLNKIITVINVTLLGQRPELETIRKVIGSNIEGETENVSLKDYLDQIQKSFLVAHTSFQQATKTLIGEVFLELDPEVLLSTKSSGLKFGPLRKAELFDTYEEKYARCKKWFDSGQFTERLLREFEKNCQKTFNTTMG